MRQRLRSRLEFSAIDGVQSSILSFPVMSTPGNTADKYDIINHNETALSPGIVAQIREWLQPTDYLPHRGGGIPPAPPFTGSGNRPLDLQDGRISQMARLSPSRQPLDQGDPRSRQIRYGSLQHPVLAHHRRLSSAVLVLLPKHCRCQFFAARPHSGLASPACSLLPELQFALQPRLGMSLAEISDNDLLQFFMNGVSGVPKLYRLGDALDEMSVESRPLSSSIPWLPFAHAPSCYSSPAQGDLQSALRDSSIVHISLQQQLVNADSAAYLNHQFEQAAKSEAHREMNSASSIWWSGDPTACSFMPTSHGPISSVHAVRGGLSIALKSLSLLA